MANKAVLLIPYGRPRFRWRLSSIVHNVRRARRYETSILSALKWGWLGKQLMDEVRPSPMMLDNLGMGIDLQVEKLSQQEG